MYYSSGHLYNVFYGIDPLRREALRKCSLDKIVGDRSYLFDRCSRQHVIANDFCHVGPGGLPGIFEYFLTNLQRVNSIPAYQQRKMRYVFQTSGPDFWSRYLKKAGLNKYVEAISDRIFTEQNHRNVYAPQPMLEIHHQLSWTPQSQQ